MPTSHIFQRVRAGNVDGGLFGYVGTYGEFTPQIAMGGYHTGDSSDLGGVFEFRLSLDIAYRFDNGHRLGVRAAHISNGGVNEQNPGEGELGRVARLVEIG